MFGPRLKRVVCRATGILILATIFFWAVPVTPAFAAPGWLDAPARKNSGAVQFELSPMGIVGGQFQFDMTVTTHSVDLSKMDFQKNSELRIGTAVYRPTGPVPLVGHHGKVKVQFPVSSIPEAFEIVIRGVPGMDNIVLRWP